MHVAADRQNECFTSGDRQMSDKTTVSRLSVRQSWLRSLHIAYTKLDQWTSCGVPEVDDELVATWGPVSKGAKPYAEPYNGDAGVAAMYANPVAAITPLGQALTRSNGAKTPKGLAAMAAQGSGGLSPWAVKAVADCRAVPRFEECSKSALSDQALAAALWAAWPGMTGMERAVRIAKAWMLDEGIEPPIIPWSQVRLDACRQLPGWSRCKASRLSPYMFAVLYWQVYQELPKNERGKDAATAAILLADELESDPTTDLHVVSEGITKTTRRGRKANGDNA
jgi:hypothetical protein